VNKHHLKPKTPPLTKTPKPPSTLSNNSQTPTLASTKEAVEENHNCLQNHHTVVAIPPENCQEHPNHRQNNTQFTQNNHRQTSKTPQTNQILHRTTPTINLVGKERNPFSTSQSNT
jgi:hypothetical protein